MVYAPGHGVPPEVAYVLARSATVVDTPAEIRSDVAQVKNGEKVQVLHRTHNWAHIRLADGKTGWIELKNLLDSQTYEQGEQQLQAVKTMPVQAAGHTNGEIRLHLQPSRQALQLALLEPNKRVEIFDREWVERAPANAQPSANTEPGDDADSSAAIREAWYLVSTGSRAGWVLGRFIALDVPANIGVYAQGVNTVAWLVLNTVEDNSRKVPEYLVADRIGTQENDFNHIRVFTWWIKNHRYVTAYVESNLDGYFPIQLLRVDDKPQFRLHLMDKNGHKFQKVYGMFDTIVRSLGVVDGWDSNAAPTRPVKRSHRH